MSDAVETPEATETPAVPDGLRTRISDELTRSLSAIWQRHAGGRPNAVTIEMSGNVVKFMIDGTADVEVEDADEAEAEPTAAESNGAPPLSTDSTRYRNEATAAVARITRRRVRGFIPKRDAKADVATDTFILEPVHIAR